MIRLPDQHKAYNPAFKVIALLPAVIVVALAVLAISFGWSYLHGSNNGVPADAAVPSGTMGADALQSRVEGTLLYPGATNVQRVTGPLSSMAGQNPLTAGMVPQLMSSAAGFAAMPIVATTFSTADSGAQVSAWYKDQLHGRGWCAPTGLNQDTGIQVYARQAREAFSIISLPVTAVQGGAAPASILLTWYALFPDPGVVPAC